MEDVIGLVAVLCAFGLPGMMMVMHHRRKMLELKLKANNTGDESLRIAVETLRREVHALRDTSTQYDMSFDTAMQRIERRVDTLENHAIATSRTETVRTAELRTGA